MAPAASAPQIASAMPTPSSRIVHRRARLDLGRPLARGAREAGDRPGVFANQRARQSGLGMRKDGLRNDETRLGRSPGWMRNPPGKPEFLWFIFYSIPYVGPNGDAVAFGPARILKS